MSVLFSRQLGKGSPLVLLHGFCENHHIWDGFAEELAKDYQVIIFDLPGFGSSDLPSDNISIDEVGALITQELNHLHVANSILIGHSLGGYVALAMMALSPLLFTGVVLFHSTSYADSEEKKGNRNKTIAFVQNHGVDPFVETFVPGLFRDKAHPSIPFVQKIALSTPIKTLIAYTKAMRDRPATSNKIVELNFPLLVLAGAYDTFVPLSDSTEISKLSRLGTLTVLKNAAHMAMLEDQEVAIQAIKEFAKQL